MKNSISYVSSVHQEAAQVKEQICRLLGWTFSEMVDFQLDNGRLYLTHYLQEEWAIKVVQNSPVFWRWWMNHWHLRDKEFLVYASGHNLIDVLAKTTVYCFMHDGYELSQTIRPSGKVLHESYAAMMQEMIDHPNPESHVTGADISC